MFGVFDERLDELEVGAPLRSICAATSRADVAWLKVIVEMTAIKSTTPSPTSCASSIHATPRFRSTPAVPRSRADPRRQRPTYVVFALLKRFLEHEGFDVTLVENITDVNDKIYTPPRAGCRRRSLQRGDDRRLPSRHRPARLGAPTMSRSQARRFPDHRADPSPDRSRRTPTRREGDVYFSVRSHLASTAKLSNRRLDDLAPRTRASRTRRRSSVIRSTSRSGRPRRKERTPRGMRPGGGGGPAGTSSAPRWRRTYWDSTSTSTAAAWTSSSASRERDRPDRGRRGRALARHWMHNGMVQFGEEKMAKSVGNITPARADVLDEFGRDVLIMYFLGGHYGKPLTSPTSSARRSDHWRGVERIAASPEPVRGRGGPIRSCLTQRGSSSPRCGDDFNTPQALAACSSSCGGQQAARTARAFPRRRPALAEEMLTVIGLEDLLAAEEPTEEEARRLAAEREGPPERRLRAGRRDPPRAGRARVRGS